MHEQARFLHAADPAEHNRTNVQAPYFISKSIYSLDGAFNEKNATAVALLNAAAAAWSQSQRRYISLINSLL
jgi:hypothetical protein